MTIEITRVEGTELHCQYQGQTGPQPVYVWLDLRAGVLSASYSGEIGNGMPLITHLGHLRRYRIPTLRAAAANALIKKIAPLAERVLAGYESEWDGNNHRARLTDDAREADDEIALLCESDWDETEMVHVWDASDWLLTHDSTATVAARLGITAASTDGELEAIAERVERDALSEDVDSLERTLPTLRRIRDEITE